MQVMHYLVFSQHGDSCLGVRGVSRKVRARGRGEEFGCCATE